jgi:hypothetical protein
MLLMAITVGPGRYAQLMTGFGMASWPGMSQQHAIEFLAAENGTGIDGWHWLIEWSTTSFYIKSMNPALEQAKVSLHGPDPKHPGKQHFRYGLESDLKLIDKSKRAGGRWVTNVSQLPAYFSGRQVTDHAGHVIRYCVEREAFVGDAPPAGGSKRPKAKATFKAIVPVPREGRVTYVDIYLSFGEPHWPDETGARAAHSGIGLITNSAGIHLTVVVEDRTAATQPNPCGDTRGDIPANECFRGLATAIDESGVLWLCDKLIPMRRSEQG